MLKFNLQNHRIYIDPLSLTVKELRDIYNSDPTETKFAAIDQLSYIHLVSQIDPEAPLFSARKDEVERLAASNVWGKDYLTIHPDLAVFHDAVKAYLEAFDRAEVRIVRAYGNKLDEFEDLLDTVKPELVKSVNNKTGAVTFTSNAAVIMKVMKDIRPIMVEKKELEEFMTQTSTKESKKWGGKTDSYLERKKKNKSVQNIRKPNEEQKPNEASKGEDVHEPVSKIPKEF